MGIVTSAARPSPWPRGAPRCRHGMAAAVTPQPHLGIEVLHIRSYTLAFVHETGQSSPPSYPGNLNSTASSSAAFPPSAPWCTCSASAVREQANHASKDDDTADKYKTTNSSEFKVLERKVY
eukprot:2549178-Pleurochrysis_carterae.AAC.1